MFILLKIFLCTKTEIIIIFLNQQNEVFIKALLGIEMGFYTKTGLNVECILLGRDLPMIYLLFRYH